MQNHVLSEVASAASPGLLDSGASELHRWLSSHAEELDTDDGFAAEILPRLGAAGLFRVGVPLELGEGGGTIVDAINVVVDIAERSLTAALVFWGQRAFIECLIQTENSGLKRRELPRLLGGNTAGAVALSNAMKFLSGIEELQIKATPLGGGLPRWKLSGTLPLFTNLAANGFMVAVAVDHGHDTPSSIFAIVHDAMGVMRGDNLDLIALRASNTAGLVLEKTVADMRFQLASNAAAFLSQVRPNFLGLQCGMSIGLARRSLSSLELAPPGSFAAMRDEGIKAESQLSTLCRQLFSGVMDGTFVKDPARLFELRIGLAEVVDAANRLEVRASGSRGYLRSRSGVARRSREAAFVPIVTPSVIQLKTHLLRRASVVSGCAPGETVARVSP